MVKIYVLCATILCLWGCGENTQEPAVADTGSQSLQELELPEKVAVNPVARGVLNDWPEFLSLETSLEGIQRAENTEDLRLVIEEMIEKENALAVSEYPARFDMPQVRSRQKVFKTHLLKVKAQLEYRKDPQQSLTEAMVAYNALCTQLNVLVNNNLDIELLSDE